MQYAPTDAYMAVIKAIRDLPGRNNTIDYLLLQTLYAAEKSLSFNAIFKTFHSSGYSRSNQTYYNAFDRLIAKGWVNVEYNKRGWRRWSITPAGRIEIERLNRRAMEYLKMQDQSDG